MNIVKVLGEAVTMLFGLTRFAAFIGSTMLGVEEAKAETLVDKWMKGE